MMQLNSIPKLLFDPFSVKTSLHDDLANFYFAIEPVAWKISLSEDYNVVERLHMSLSELSAPVIVRLLHVSLKQKPEEISSKDMSDISPPALL